MANLFGIGSASPDFNLSIGTEGLQVFGLDGMTRGFTFFMRANLIDNFGIDCGIGCFDGLAYNFSNHEFVASPILPQRAWITVIMTGVNGQADITYPYTLKPRFGPVENPGQPAHENCLLDRELTLHTLGQRIEMFTTAQADLMAIITTMEQNIEGTSIVFAGLPGQPVGVPRREFLAQTQRLRV